MTFRDRIKPTRPTSTSKRTAKTQMQSLDHHVLWLVTLFSIANFACCCCAQQGFRLFGSDAVVNSSLPPACGMTYQELEMTDRNNILDPCILTDEEPTVAEADANITSIITVVGVTERRCGSYVAGAAVAVEKLNGANEGMGMTIGYNRDRYVKFRLVVAVGGSEFALGDRPPDRMKKYGEIHEALLEDLIISLSPQYILGSCKIFGEFDKHLAGKHEIMVLSLGASQKFYRENSNNHVFGVYVPSETYGASALKAIQLAKAEGSAMERQKVRVIYSDTSEHHYNMCNAIYERALEMGFTDTLRITYDARADHDGNGIPNRKDTDFLNSLADMACPPNESGDGQAVFICTVEMNENNNVLRRFRDNMCRPSLIWSYSAGTREWSSRHTEFAPYIMTDNQWHPGLTYSDEFFESGQDMLDYMSQNLGANDPASIATYTAMYIMYKNVWSHFKAQDSPDVKGTVMSSYEDIRRSMLDLFLPETLYGAISFDADRRNVGRGSAGMQWLVPADSTDGKFRDMLVSPTSQAEVGIVYPSPVNATCDAGSYFNGTRARNSSAVLEGKCDYCPKDTFQRSSNMELSCLACPDGSTTEGEVGSTICVVQNENLVSSGLLTFGFVVVGINFLLSIIFMSWTVYYGSDPVVRLGQKEFLLLLCGGTLLSSSSIIPLSVQAGVFDDTESASQACMAVPWLYSTGWILQYSSLFAKSYRMLKVMKATRRLRQTKIPAKQTLIFVFAALLLNWAIVLPWTISDPFIWERDDLGITYDNGVVMHETVGRCNSEHLAAWIGSMLGYHLSIMIATNIMLWQLRFMNDRYQESKYVTLASLFACEFLLLGIPILIAVGDSADLRYIVLVVIIAFSDMGIMLLVFVPKILFQREGLPANTSVMGSVMNLGNNSNNANRISSLPSARCTYQHRAPMAPPKCTTCSSEMKMNWCCLECCQETKQLITSIPKEESDSNSHTTGAKSAAANIESIASTPATSSSSPSTSLQAISENSQSAASGSFLKKICSTEEGRGSLIQ